MIKTYTPGELKAVLVAHRKWLYGEEGGARANLTDADLTDANLTDAVLTRADLTDANLTDANLTDANLTRANLTDANLTRANLTRANLTRADLTDAVLTDAVLTRADLPSFQICPEEGSFIAWKKVQGAVLKLEVPADARRVGGLIGRKCRASSLKVLEAFPTGAAVHEAPFAGFRSRHDPSFIYRVGATAHAPDFDPDIRLECTGGLHFFMTRKEAENY